MKICKHCGKQGIIDKNGREFAVCHNCWSERSKSKVFSQESRNKMSKSAKNKIITKETREKMSKSLMKHIVTKETRKKIAVGLNKFFAFPEAREKKRLERLGTHASEESKEKNRLKHVGKPCPWKGKTKENYEPLMRGAKKCSATNQGIDIKDWTHFVSHKDYTIEFTKQLKESIRKRDNYYCQMCFKHQNKQFSKTKGGKIVNKKLSVHHIDYNKKNNSPENLISLCMKCHMKTNYNRPYWISYFDIKIHGTKDKLRHPVLISIKENVEK